MKRALKIFGVGVLFGLGLSFGLGIGQKTGSLVTQAFAQVKPQPNPSSGVGNVGAPMPFESEVKIPQNPSMTGPSIGTNIIIAHNSVCDRLVVQGVDLFEWVNRLQMHLIANGVITKKNGDIIINASSVKYTFEK